MAAQAAEDQNHFVTLKATMFIYQRKAVVAEFVQQSTYEQRTKEILWHRCKDNIREENRWCYSITVAKEKTANDTHNHALVSLNDLGDIQIEAMVQ